MTENEVFEGIHKDCGMLEICDYKKTGCGDCFIRQTLIKAEKALEEIQAYRAIGTIEELQEMKSGDFTEHLLNMGYTKGIKNGYNKAIDECIEIIEETVWKDTDMLVESIRELKGGAE